MWLSTDPLQEKYPNISSYAFTLLNPVKYIDPNGESTHVDSDGNIIAVFNDDNLGVYQHKKNADGGNPTEFMLSKRIEKYGVSSGGENIGETEYWDEFIIPGTTEASGKILAGESWKEAIDDLHAEAMKYNLKEIGEKSKLNQDFDLKSKKEWASEGVMTGKLLNGKYATARSAGNYLAGYNGREGTLMNVHIEYETYMKLAGALQVGEYNKANAAKIVLFGTSFGPAPWYGEQEYSGRRIKEGWFGKSPAN